jgi:hypothetical protein
VLPEVHKMDAPLNSSGVPEGDDEQAAALRS